MNKTEFEIKTANMNVQIEEKSDLTTTKIIMNVNGVGFSIIWDNKYFIRMIVPESVLIEKYKDGDYVRKEEMK